jgi:hypothetical protein
MLGFRGHFLTKSRRYSSTFTAIRAQRRAHRVAAVLATLNDGEEPDAAGIDPDTVIVVNDWWPVRFGHRDDAERELAAAIAERRRTQRRNTTTGHRRAA